MKSFIFQTLKASSNRRHYLQFSQAAPYRSRQVDWCRRIKLVGCPFNHCILMSTHWVLTEVVWIPLNADHFSSAEDFSADCWVAQVGNTESINSNPPVMKQYSRALSWIIMWTLQGAESTVLHIHNESRKSIPKKFKVFNLQALHSSSQASNAKNTSQCYHTPLS